MRVISMVASGVYVRAGSSGESSPFPSPAAQRQYIEGAVGQVVPGVQESAAAVLLFG